MALSDKELSILKLAKTQVPTTVMSQFLAAISDNDDAARSAIAAYKENTLRDIETIIERANNEISNANHLKDLLS